MSIILMIYEMNFLISEVFFWHFVDISKGNINFQDRILLQVINVFVK